MKKITALILAVMMLLSVTACASKEYARGTVKNNAYKSSYLGLKVRFPEDWTVKSEEEVEDMVDFSDEDLSENSQYADQLAKEQSINELVAMTNNGTSSLLMVLNNIEGGSEDIQDLETYAKYLEASTLNNAYIEYEAQERVASTFHGYDCFMQDFTALEGLLLQRSIVFAKDDYRVVITMITMAGVEYTLDDIQNFWK